VRLARRLQKVRQNLSHPGREARNGNRFGGIYHQEEQNEKNHHAVGCIGYRSPVQ
jgi:hypothetical protein